MTTRQQNQRLREIAVGGRQIVERVIQTLERYQISDAAREGYLASYESDRYAESIRYVQTYPKEL